MLWIINWCLWTNVCCGYQVSVQYRWIDLREIEIVDIVLPDHTDEEIAHEKKYQEIVQERLMPNTPLVPEGEEA